MDTESGQSPLLAVLSTRYMTGEYPEGPPHTRHSTLDSLTSQAAGLCEHWTVAVPGIPRCKSRFGETEGAPFGSTLRSLGFLFPLAAFHVDPRELQ